MAKISRLPVKREKLEHLYNDLCLTIASLNSTEGVKAFLYDLLTHTERKMLAKRFQIAVMLVRGRSYQEIKDALKVTDATVAKVNNWLKTGAKSLQRVIEETIGGKEDDFDDKRKGDKYMAGNLLMPAIEEGARIIKKHLKK